MKKLIFVVLLVALLLSLTLTVVLAGEAWDDPINPGGRDFGCNPPPGLVGNPGNGGHNWEWPTDRPC